MSNDKNDKTGGLLGNPLPIVMVVLLAAGLLVKIVPLESARPTDPDRMKFVSTSQQDVEARLWQDPFAAVEQHEKSFGQAVTPAAKILMVLPAPHTPKTLNECKKLEQCSESIVTAAEGPSPAPHTPEALHKRIKELHDKVTVVAVSVFGGSFNEAAEIRRRSRFALVSALGFHHYHPEDADAIGYFHIDLSETHADNLTVPFEWFEKEDKSSNVLVLWLNEDRLTTKPLKKLHAIFTKLTPPRASGRHATSSAAKGDGFNVKLVGPAGSAMLKELIKEKSEWKTATGKDGGGTLEVFSPSATISVCDLYPSGRPANISSWNCFMKSSDPQAERLETPLIIRTTGTDDVLSAALLWELWQRGVNRDSWPEQIWAFVNGQGNISCEDGLVLIGEQDTEYGRTLLGDLRDGFSERCRATPRVRTFTYLRGLDGVLPDIDKSASNTPPKDDSSKSKDLLAQIKDVPPEHAEGRSQLDYLRRLADEIDRLDHDKKFFAKKGVTAIGVVGSDLYDKLLILQALRSRFKEKIFFTTDLDARYLHADQKDWARNLVVASNFGLSLRPALQHSTLPFRDSYQTATYLATLMALDSKSHDHWTIKMREWLHPQIFEIGRTEAVHLASPSIEKLTKLANNDYTEIGQTLVQRLMVWIKTDDFKDLAEAACDVWDKCKSIEPVWPARGVSLERLPVILFMFLLCVFLLSLTSRYVPDVERAIKYLVFSTAMVVFIILAVVWFLMNDSLVQGVGEPFVWLEGVSVWPNLVLRFVGLVTTVALAFAFIILTRRQTHRISDHFGLPLPQTWTLPRNRWSAMWSGPRLSLESFVRESKPEASLANKEESTETKTKVTTLWQNYLRATSFREMAWWVVVSVLLVCLLSLAACMVLESPSFPHRGQLVETLHYILMLFNGPVLWLVTFWVGYETRACARFIETLSKVRSLWPEVLLDREEVATGVPRAHLDHYLDFRLIVLATQRIHGLIYLPFISIIFMVLSRSSFFDTMDFPLALVFVTGLALTYALYSEVLLRRSAESARVTALEKYENRLLVQGRAIVSQPPILLVSPAAGPVQLPISAEQIKILMERIRDTHDGAFAPIAQQPALRALLLPFGSFGVVQLIEYFLKL